MTNNSARRLKHPEPHMWRGWVRCGRIEPRTGFAGIWGGATMQACHGRGIPVAQTAARARSALATGKTLAHSDSTEYSRPVLERSVMVKVSTTTPYNGKR